MENNKPVYAIERIESLDAATRLVILDLWEGSVRGTHHFLREEDIANLRPLVGEALKGVSLYAAREGDGRIAAFAGVAEDKLEMLFVRIEDLRKGIGGLLLRHLLDKGVTRVDVNEQNPRALAFYRKMGFAATGRSELDGQGRHFPLLHLQLRP